MAKRSLNTRQGGHVTVTRSRSVVADPKGNREQRRAAAKLARKEGSADHQSTEEPDHD